MTTHMFINYVTSTKKCSSPNMYFFIIKKIEHKVEKHASHIKELVIVFVYSEVGDSY